MVCAQTAEDIDNNKMISNERSVFRSVVGLFKEINFIKLKSSLRGILVCKGRNFISHSTKLLAIFEFKITDKMIEDLKNGIYLDNSAWDLILFGGIILLGFILRRFFSNSFSKIVYRFLPNESISIQDCVQLIRKPFELLIFWIFLFFAVKNLHIPSIWGIEPINKTGLLYFINKAYESAVIFTVTWVIVRLMKVVILVAQEKWNGADQKSKQQFIPFLNDLSMVFIITAAGFVFLGRIFEVDVVALITGLGIGGLALALAARETLENLFASFTIFLDLPFVVGDNIQIGSISGDIEKIGFRSTRIRGADGNLILVPNRLLTSQSLENMSERDYRRAKYTILCELNTKPSQIETAIASIESLILEDPLCKKKTPKVILEGFGAYSIDISVTYFVQTKDFAKFQATKQAINLGILKVLEKEKIVMARS
jgi:MscS family membrane protein